MSSPISINSSRINSSALMFKGFNRRGQVNKVLRDFDKQLDHSIQDELALRGSHLEESEQEELETELRKQALPNELEFEKRLSEAYRKDYEKNIPEKYLKQAVRCIKNMLERVRFYGYSPSTVHVKDYAPPFDDETGGRKFTELENKSWASISEPDDERYPGWHQSTTPEEDIIRWLQEPDEATDTTEQVVSRLKRTDVAQEKTAPGKHRATSLDALPTHPNKKSRAHSGKMSSEDSNSSVMDTTVARDQSPAKEPINTTDHPSHQTPHRSEWSQYPGSMSDQAGKDAADEQQMSPFGTEEKMGLLSAPTPGRAISPGLPAYNWKAPRFVFPVPSRWQSRVPTPGLDHREELNEALQKTPPSVSDIAHYFNLAHQGTKGERARALFRLSRDIAHDKNIDIDQYLTGSGPSSRQASPHSESSRRQSPSGQFEKDEILDTHMY